MHLLNCIDIPRKESLKCLTAKNNSIIIIIITIIGLHQKIIINYTRKTKEESKANLLNKIKKKKERETHKHPHTQTNSQDDFFSSIF